MALSRVVGKRGEGLKIARALAQKEVGSPKRCSGNPRTPGSNANTYVIVKRAEVTNSVASSGPPKAHLSDLFGKATGQPVAQLLEEGVKAMKIRPFDIAAEKTRGQYISGPDLRAALSPFEKIRPAEAENPRLRRQSGRVQRLGAGAPERQDPDRGAGGRGAREFLSERARMICGQNIAIDGGW